MKFVKNLCTVLFAFLVGLLPVEASTWGTRKNPTINVDLLLVFFLVLSVILLALFYRIRDRRTKSHPAIKVITAVSVILLIVTFVLMIAIFVAGNPDQQTFSVNDTDVAGDTTNASITKIAVDGVYENEHLIFLPYPDYEEDLILYIEKEDIYGNGTATIEIYALNSNGNIEETKSKTVTLKDYETNIIRFRDFEEMYPEYVINLTYNGSSDLDKVSVSRTLDSCVWTSDYSM